MVNFKTNDAFHNYVFGVYPFLRLDDGNTSLRNWCAFWYGNMVIFQEATNMGDGFHFVNRGDLLRKLNFSKEIIVISSVVSAAINYGINLLVVFVFALVNGVHPKFGRFRHYSIVY